MTALNPWRRTLCFGLPLFCVVSLWAPCPDGRMEGSDGDGVIVWIQY